MEKVFRGDQTRDAGRPRADRNTNADFAAALQDGVVEHSNPKKAHGIVLRCLLTIQVTELGRTPGNYQSNIIRRRCGSHPVGQALLYLIADFLNR